MTISRQISRPIGHTDIRRRIAIRSAPWFFWLSLAFLVCQAVLMVVLIDIPNLSENAILAIDSESPRAEELRASLAQSVVDDRVPRVVVGVMLLIWPIFVAESIFHWLTRPWDAAMRKYHFLGWLVCVSPSLRMCAHSPEMNHRLWLPGLGWRVANRRLRRRLERKFSLPMILIATMILPLLIIEFFLKAQVAQYEWLRLLLHVGTGVIWFAFALEFVLMISIANKRLRYCRRNWIDLAIILLPLFSFLRMLRVVRATKVLKIPQLTKFVRVYRLRGTAVKLLRGLMLLELVDRLWRGDAEKSIERLRGRLREVESEAREIRREILRLERQRADQESRDLSQDNARPE